MFIKETTSLSEIHSASVTTSLYSKGELTGGARSRQLTISA
jgi:hypothetical protein